MNSGHNIVMHDDRVVSIENRIVQGPFAENIIFREKIPFFLAEVYFWGAVFMAKKFHFV